MMSKSPKTSFPHDTPADEALVSMSDADQQAAIVMERGHPVGIVTRAALDANLVDAASDATVSDLMDFYAVHVDPTLGVEDTLRAFRVAAWHSLDRRHPFARKQAQG